MATRCFIHPTDFIPDITTESSDDATEDYIAILDENAEAESMTFISAGAAAITDPAEEKTEESISIYKVMLGDIKDLRTDVNEFNKANKSLLKSNDVSEDDEFDSSVLDELGFLVERYDELSIELEDIKRNSDIIDGISKASRTELTKDESETDDADDYEEYDTYRYINAARYKILRGKLDDIYSQTLKVGYDNIGSSSTVSPCESLYSYTLIETSAEYNVTIAIGHTIPQTAYVNATGCSIMSGRTLAVTILY